MSMPSVSDLELEVYVPDNVLRLIPGYEALIVVCRTCGHLPGGERSGRGCDRCGWWLTWENEPTTKEALAAEDERIEQEAMRELPYSWPPSC